jgi:hypothetical protein
MTSTLVRLGEIVGVKDMAGATSVVAAPPLRSFLSTVGVVPPTILTSVGPVPDAAVPNVAVPDVAVPDVGMAGVMADLALVLSAACSGGLSGVSAEQALRVVEAVEAVKAWADSVAIDAVAAMVTGFETEWVHLAPEPSRSPWSTTRGWQRFFNLPIELPLESWRLLQ